VVNGIAASSAGVIMAVDNETVKLCSVATGCSPTTITDLATQRYNLRGVTVVGTDVYFFAAPSDPWILYSCPVAGCPPAGPNVVENNNDTIGAVAAGPDMVYWTRYSYCSNYSERCSLPGCTGISQLRLKAGSCANPYSDNTNNPSHEMTYPSSVVSAGAATVLWGTGGLYNDSTKFLRGCANTGTCVTPQEIDTGDTVVNALAYYDGFHYGAGGASIFRVADVMGTTTRTVVASDAQGLTGIAADASGIYWVNGTTGNVRRCPKLTGCTSAEVETLAVGQTGAKAIAIDANNVYWSLATKVMRVVK
jgi:hypothetical protein